MEAIKTEKLSFTYEAGGKVLDGIDLSVSAGECLLLTGPSGCGKTTLLRVLNGLAPHYFPGILDGKAFELGECINGKEIYEISKHIGTVFQNPRSQFFCVDTESELAFASENAGLDEDFIRERINETVKSFSLEKLVGKSLFAMSGGQRQKIACASIDVNQPEIILLDEPSANLDYESTALLAEIIKGWKQAGKTVLIADHRTAYIQGIADRVLLMGGGKIKETYTGEEFNALTEDKRREMQLRSGSFEDPENIKLPEPPESADCILCKGLSYHFKSKLFAPKGSADRIDFRDMRFEKGRITAIVGKNGVGKTSFLRSFCKKEGKKVFLVMQDVNHELFTDSVSAEVTLSLPKGGDEAARRDRVREILEQMDISEFADRHPMSLSGGQKQRVAIACAMASGREILLFDEPTSGLDYRHMRDTAAVLKKLKEMGKTVMIVTHDAELIRECCERIVSI